MKLKFAIGLIGCPLLLLLTPTTLSAQTIDYGTTRRPKTCSSQANPEKGAPTVAQAKLYFLCDLEWLGSTEGPDPSPLWLTDDLTIQIAPTSRSFNTTDLSLNKLHGGRYLTMDTEKPVYDIRGSYTSYVCYAVGNSWKVGKNCDVSYFSSSTGICFLDSFGEWHCRMRGGFVKANKNVAPPEKWNSPK
jgi:hypothetical protein